MTKFQLYSSGLCGFFCSNKKKINHCVKLVIFKIVEFGLEKVENTKKYKK